MHSRRERVAAFAGLCLLAAAQGIAEDAGFATTWSDPPGVEGFTNPTGPLTNPGKDGNPDGFLKAVRSGADVLVAELMSIRPGLPVIVCTGYSQNIDAERATQLGIRAFVMKPILIHELAAAVRKALVRETPSRSI